MIIHELTTNALKHGALSAPETRVSIEGKISPDERFLFSWKETGGPRVSRPTSKGFGSVILLDAAEQFGHATQTFKPEGMSYELEVDLDAIEASRKSAPNC